MALISFKHSNATSLDQAVSNLAKHKEKAALIAGGTDLLGVLKDNIHPTYPEFLVNIKTISDLDYIKESEEGLKIGALTIISDIEKNKAIKEKYRVLAEAARSVASLQIRNMGTIGGNICQEPRCWYYRNPENMFYCIRKAGKICNALTGENRYHSIFGAARVVTPPCSSKCPGTVDIPSYLSRIRDGELLEAAKILLDCNPIPAITGRVCPHFCEEECNRDEFDEPVSIRAIERFMGDYILQNLTEIVRPPETNTGKTVAVVGSGPAGLTAGYYLAKAEHLVTVFEQFPKAGGMMRVGIPDYRLPPDVLDAEIAKIQRGGVNINLNTKIESIDWLFEQGYDAVFLALGAHRGMQLGIEGEDTQGVVDGAAFLRDISLGKKVDVGDKVAVIGGGNAAIDSARTARRFGAKKVTIVYRRTRAEMPASEEEIEGALEEGVDIIYLAAPVKIGQDGSRLKLTCIRMELGEPDASGRRRPVPIKGSEFSADFDSIIAAIGQTPEIPSQFNLKTGRGNTIQVNPDMLATSRQGVWAGGDAATGPASVIEAIAAGRIAAESIDRYLKGQEKQINGKGEEITQTLEKFNSNYLKRTSRVELPELPIAERSIDTEDFLGLDLSKIETEANRCFNCGCVAVNASDIATVLVALCAKIKTTKKTIEAEEFFTVKPMKSNILDIDEIVTEIQVPSPKPGTKQSFFKFRIRNSLDFPIVSLASVVNMNSGRINDAKLVLGAVAPIPLRIKEAEDFLKGKLLSEELAEAVGNVAVKGVIPLAKNKYKIQIIKALLMKAILALR